MKRSDLLKLPELKVTVKMRKAIQEDKGFRASRYRNSSVHAYNWYWFYRARKTGEVLEIDVYTRDMILNGLEHPRYRVFLLEDNKYYTYDKQCEKWRTAKIDNLEYDPERQYENEGYWYSKRYVWIEEKDRKVIAAFCNNGKEETRAAVAHWQNYSKNRAEIDEIDSEMALVPELPKDFDKFVEKEVLPQYIFYDAVRKVTEGYCTHCKRTVKIRNPKYGKHGNCPSCKHPIQYKTRKKSGNITDDAYAGLLQKTPEGYVYRHFYCVLAYENGIKGSGGYWETIRITYDFNFRKRNSFEFFRYKQTDWRRWCYKTTGWNYYENVHEHKTILYERNLKRILRGSPLQYSAMEHYVKHGNNREKLYMDWFIDAYKHNSGLEQLIKCGYYNLAKAVIEDGAGHYLSPKERACKKILGVGAEYYKLLTNKNPTKRQYEVAREAWDIKIALTWQQVQFFSRTERNFAIYIRHTTPHRMARYIKEKLNEGSELIREYHDYLQMAAGLDYNLQDEWVLYPKNLKERHEELIEEQREREIQMEEVKDNAKDDLFREFQKRDSYLEMETDSFILRLPKRIHEIRKEGQYLHHCVATYIERVARGKTTILFLRKKEAPNTPFYTMEVSGGKMIQCRAKYNGDMTKEVKAFVDLFKKTKLRKTERRAG